MATKDIPTRDGLEPKAPAREASRSDPLLTPKDAARFMSVSGSWLAKARIRGDGRRMFKSVVQFGISKAI
jgi:hypothetical protein